MSHETPDRERVLEIARDARIAMLTSTSADGDLHARPMTPQRVDDDASIWFLVAADTDQARDVGARPQVNVSFAESGAWLSVAGHGELLDDRDRIEEFWSSASEAWFPEGPDDPGCGCCASAGSRRSTGPPPAAGWPP
nr:pyridoxamine 5'-phosphate oxidase family protein [Nocardioides solisilvae]